MGALIRAILARRPGCALPLRVPARGQMPADLRAWIRPCCPRPAAMRELIDSRAAPAVADGRPVAIGADRRRLDPGPIILSEARLSAYSGRGLSWRGAINRGLMGGSPMCWPRT